MATLPGPAWAVSDANPALLLGTLLRSVSVPQGPKNAGGPNLFGLRRILRLVILGIVLISWTLHPPYTVAFPRILRPIGTVLLPSKLWARKPQPAAEHGELCL